MSVTASRDHAWDTSEQYFLLGCRDALLAEVELLKAEIARLDMSLQNALQAKQSMTAASEAEIQRLQVGFHHLLPSFRMMTACWRWCTMYTLDTSIALPSWLVLKYHLLQFPNKMLCCTGCCHQQFNKCHVNPRCGTAPSAVALLRRLKTFCGNWVFFGAVMCQNSGKRVRERARQQQVQDQ